MICLLTVDQNEQYDATFNEDGEDLFNEMDDDDDIGMSDESFNDLDLNGSTPKSVLLANDLITFPIPPELDFSSQIASKASVELVRKYLEENPNYPLKKKIETNLKNQIIPKLCDGQYQLQPSTLGYTLFDAKVVPRNGRIGWLRCFQPGR